MNKQKGDKVPLYFAYQAFQEVINVAARYAQARLYVTQALAIGELGEGHRQILIPARRSLQPNATLTALRTAAELQVCPAMPMTIAVPSPAQ